MAELIRASGKAIRFYVVDTWAGNPNQHAYVARAGGPDMVHLEFLRNMQVADIFDLVNPIRLPSIQAASVFEDHSLDFVFIDACHEYDSVKADIAAWLPKLVSGGMIAGHDYSDLWPGVVKAVDELIGNPIDISEGCWIHRVQQ